MNLAFFYIKINKFRTATPPTAAVTQVEPPHLTTTVIFLLTHNPTHEGPAADIGG